jgi:hypothetical protein
VASGEEQPLLTNAFFKRPSGTSPDGRWLLYEEYHPKTLWDLWLAPLDGKQQSIPFLRTEFDELYGQISPDGRWIAYQSNESRQNEIYVREFDPHRPGLGSRSRLSTGGGVEPRWRGDSRELYYLAPDRKLMAVELKPGSGPGTLAYDQPRELFATRATGVYYRYAASSDGRRFVVLTQQEEPAPQPATVIVNWAQGLP